MFDPIHNGHLDVIQRSLRIFDELIVAVVANPSKEPLFPSSERLQMIDEVTAELSSTVETVFLMPHEKYTYISSRLIKEVASFGASVAGLVPPVVEKRLSEKFPPK